MKKYKSLIVLQVVFIAVSALLIGCSSGDDTVIVKESKGVSCNAIAGSYFFPFDLISCDGMRYQGTIKATVTKDCSFSAVTNYGDTVKGTFTDKSGSTFSGTGQSSQCGDVDVTCTVKNGKIEGCTFSFLN